MNIKLDTFKIKQIQEKYFSYKKCFEKYGVQNNPFFL